MEATKVEALDNRVTRMETRMDSVDSKLDNITHMLEKSQQHSSELAKRDIEDLQKDTLDLSEWRKSIFMRVGIPFVSIVFACGALWFNIMAMDEELEKVTRWQDNWPNQGELKHDTEQNIKLENLDESLDRLWKRYELHTGVGTVKHN